MGLRSNSQQPKHDDYVHLAVQLEETAKDQLRPYAIRRVFGWIAAVVITIAMALLVYVVLQDVLHFPPLIAILVAMGFQFITISACHAYFHGQYRGENRWNVKFFGAAIASTVMLVIAYLRAKMFLEDSGDMPPVASFLISFIVSLIEPLVSWGTGCMTGSAQYATEAPSEILKRARLHSRSVRENEQRQRTWQVSIELSNEEIDQLETSKPRTVNDIKQKEREIKILKDWRRLLRQFDPNPMPSSMIPPEEQLSSLRSDT